MRTHPSPLMAILSVSLAAAFMPLSGASAQELRQIELTEKHITSFIDAQSDFEPLVEKLSEAADRPDEKLQSDLDTASKKHGFASFDEYMDVNDNIAFVMSGINRDNMEFTEPVERLKKDLEEIKADNEIPADEKKLAVEDLTQEISASEPLKYPGNVDIVKRHFAELQKLLPEDSEMLPEEDDGEDSGAADDGAGGEDDKDAKDDAGDKDKGDKK